MDTIKFKYVFPDDYKTEQITGVYGGITSCGDIEAHFYYEHSALPREMEFEVTEDGQLGDLVKVSPADRKIIPSITNGLTMRREVAISFRDWLDEKIRLMGGSHDSDEQ